MRRWGLCACLVTALFLGGLAVGDITTWNGTGDWAAASANWDQGVPGEGDTAVIASGTVVLSAETPLLAALALNAGRLVMSNWTTRLRATTVTIAGGSIGLPAAFTNDADKNRIWIECEDLTLAAGARIDAGGGGWAGKPQGDAVRVHGYGPGAGRNTYASAGYGGYGNRQGDAGFGGSCPYGAASASGDPGSGGAAYQGAGNVGGAGGGAIRIEASGDVTVDGTIGANGQDAPNNGGGGSGGSVWISCRTVRGSGIVEANGADSQGLQSGPSPQLGAGGGRVAIAYDPAAQALIPVPALRVSAGSIVKAPAKDEPGELGTLWFPDERFLQRAPLTGLTGQWQSASAELRFARLTVSNAWLRFVADGIQLVVSNDLAIAGNARVEIGGNSSYSNFYWGYQTAAYGTMPRPFSLMATNPSLACRDLTLRDGGTLWVYAGVTNAAAGTGAVVRVTHRLSIETNAWLYPVSHGTNGGQVVLELAGLRIDAGGGIKADATGWGCARGAGNTKGYGPGGGYYNNNHGIGAGHGGKGGQAMGSYGQPYGSSNEPPFSCGSGGGIYGPGYRAGSGGGLVHIEAPWADLVVAGTISAGGGGAGWASGAGSGGGIYIVCQGLAGAGRIQANGGGPFLTEGNVGTGGGGRIAVFRRPERDTFTGTCSAGAGAGGTFLGEAGTVFLGESEPPKGGLGVLGIVK